VRASDLLLLLVVVAGCSPEKRQSSTLTPGESQLEVPGGTIWYKVSAGGTGTPVVLLHGGPGFSSFYLKPLEALADDRVVIRYDQLGGGKSSSTTDTTLFTIPHFVQELDSLRSHLGIAKWHVLGHSWGTILAFEYYRAYPNHVASLVFGSPVFDIPTYEKRARELLTTLPNSLQRSVARAEATGKFDAPDYQNAINAFYSLYVFRRPVPADLDSTFGTANQTIYNYMQGPSEFTITGTLKGYDVTRLLPQIKVPTLLTVGEFDEVGPELVKGFAARIPGARFEELAGAAHITTWDAPDAMISAVRAFLRSADTVAARAPS
jgi:proline iminopeptidase